MLTKQIIIDLNLILIYILSIPLPTSPELFIVLKQVSGLYHFILNYFSKVH